METRNNDLAIQQEDLLIDQIIELKDIQKTDLTPKEKSRILHQYLLEKEKEAKTERSKNKILPEHYQTFFRNKYFAKGKEFTANGEKFTFKKSLIRTSKMINENEKEYSYTVVNNERIGSGGFGIIKKSGGSIRHANDCMMVDKEKNTEVIKRQLIYGCHAIFIRMFNDDFNENDLFYLAQDYDFSAPIFIFHPVDYGELPTLVSAFGCIDGKWQITKGLNIHSFVDENNIPLKLPQPSEIKMLDAKNISAKVRKEINKVHDHFKKQVRAQNHESKILNMAGYIETRKIAFVKDLEGTPICSYIVMEKLQGEVFSNILDVNSFKRFQQSILTLKSFTEFTIEMRIKLLQNLIGNLKYLQDERGIMHNDIKPENIFLLDNKKMTTKIFDFGLSCEKTEMLICPRGTPIWLSPDMVKHPETVNATGKSDIFSLGLLLKLIFLDKNTIELFSTYLSLIRNHNVREVENFIKKQKAALFSGRNDQKVEFEEEMINCLKKAKVDIDKLATLLEKMTAGNPRDRYSLDEIALNLENITFFAHHTPTVEKVDDHKKSKCTIF